MVNFKFFISLSAVGIILASSPSFSMDDVLEEEKGIAYISSNLQLDNPQARFTYNGKMFIKGEVPGDGSCLFHTLHLFFPHKGISRNEFVKRLRNILQKNGQDAEEVREELAREFVYSLYENWTESFDLNLLTQKYTEFKGDNIKQLLPQLKFSFDDNTHDVNLIKNNPHVMNEILDTLNQNGKMPSLSANAKLLGTFGLICKIFDVNLDIFTTVKGKNTLELRRKFRFDANNVPTQSALFNPVGNHVSPLCESNNNQMRKRLADRIFQMVHEGTGVFKTFEKNIRATLLSNMPWKPESVSSIPNPEFFFEELQNTYVNNICLAPNQKQYVKDQEEHIKTMNEQERELHELALSSAKMNFDSLTGSAEIIDDMSLIENYRNTFQNLILLVGNIKDIQRDIFQDLQNQIQGVNEAEKEAYGTALILTQIQFDL